MSRFHGVRQQLPTRYDDPRLDRLRSVLDTVFHHHAMQLAVAMDFLTFEGSFEQLHRQVTGFTGLGHRPRCSRDVYRELRGRD